jgi:hypothetical protein
MRLPLSRTGSGRKEGALSARPTRTGFRRSYKSNTTEPQARSSDRSHGAASTVDEQATDVNARALGAEDAELVGTLWQLEIARVSNRGYRLLIGL